MEALVLAANFMSVPTGTVLCKQLDAGEEADEAAAEEEEAGDAGAPPRLSKLTPAAKRLRDGALPPVHTQPMEPLFCIIIQGEVEVSMTNLGVIETLGTGDSFGHVALTQPRVC